MTAHEHIWKGVDVGCEDCGEYPGLECSGEPQPCSVVEAEKGSRGYIESISDEWPAQLDLIFAEDPRG